MEYEVHHQYHPRTDTWARITIRCHPTHARLIDIALTDLDIEHSIDREQPGTTIVEFEGDSETIDGLIVSLRDWRYEADWERGEELGMILADLDGLWDAYSETVPQ